MLNIRYHHFYHPSLLLICCYFCLIFFSVETNANYVPIIQNPSHGYLIHLDNNRIISPNPVVGTDGKNYYKVNQTTIHGRDPFVSMTGTIQCLGQIWGNSNTHIPSNYAFHRLFIYMPTTGIHIEGKMGYRINSNVVMTVDSKIINWLNITDSNICSYASDTTIEPISAFQMHFPFTLTFYMNDKIVDSHIVIPAIDLGGYVRAFMDHGNAPTHHNWPFQRTTIPIRLAPSQINVASYCIATTGSEYINNTMNLYHGQLNSLHYDNLITEQVIYRCPFAKSTNMTLRLDYRLDNDIKKRLPMLNQQDKSKKIYSELKINDEMTGQSGTRIKVNIKDFKRITISSHIQGNNAVAGHYHGSAWLIATFD